jgi:hypothetical protein
MYMTLIFNGFLEFERQFSTHTIIAGMVYRKYPLLFGGTEG